MAGKEKVLFKDGVYYYKKGWKQDIGSITKVYVKGTDDERGFQLGKLLAHEIKSVFKHFLFFTIKRGRPPFFVKWLPMEMLFLLKPLLRLLYGKKVRKLMAKYPAWMVKELEGMARGAGIHPFYLKFMNVGDADENTLGDKDLGVFPLKSCCSFAFIGEDGHLYHGKNLDWVPNTALIDFICFQQREDEGGDSFSIIGPPGILSVYEFGMNSRGITIGLTGRFFRGKRPSPLALTNAVELRVLRFGKNLEEIQKIYNTKTGFNRTDALLISSEKDGDYKLFEVAPIGAAVTSAKNGVLFNTNSYIHPLLQKYNRQWGNIFNDEFCDPRYKRLKELMAKKTGTRDHAFEILGDTRQPGFEHKSFLGQASINRFVTQVSLLAVRGKHPGIWIARDYTYAASNEYFFFDFSAEPRATIKKREAGQVIYSEKFKNFKDFMILRESRYYVSPGKIINGGKELLKREPTNPIFILFLAQNYQKYRKFGRAVTLLLKHPIEWAADYWYCLGKCSLELKKIEDAKKYFLKAMDLPGIDGFDELVKTVCLVQLVKANEKLGLYEETRRLKQELKTLQSKFATPDIGMPDYPYINNIIEQMEEVIL